MADGCLFLTGATGLLGGELVRLFRNRRPERAIVALVRQPEQAARLEQPGVTAVVGDLSRPWLGLDASDYERLTRSVTEIVHGAADVRFDQTLAASRAVNFHGVRHMLDLARACRGLHRMAHVSSIYVNGYRQGFFAEEPLPPGQRFVNAYQQSKFEAEGLVLEAMRDIPLSIYRLSLVICDSARGEVSQFNYFHHLLRCIPGCPLPIMPGEPAVKVDLIPNDWSASVLAHIFDCRFTPGAIRHICAGPDFSIPLSEAIDIVCRTVESHPSNTSRAPKPAPRMVSVGEYNRFLEHCEDDMLRNVAEALGRHVRLLGIRQSHSNQQTLADVRGAGIELPAMAAYLRNAVNYCLDTDWGKRSPARVSHG